MSLSRYWHTLRHLKAVQLYGRVWFRLHSPAPDLRRAPGLRAASGRWALPARREASVLAPTFFRFLNVTRDLAECGWDDVGVDKLWRYNLHYFDDLNARDALARKAWHGALLARWVAQNPPARGAGWEPYPTSLRIVNWIKWALAGNALPAECVHSLAVQARQLERRLEFHLLGNHLFANAKALVFAGQYFAGDEAARWRRTGTAILEQQVPEQILSDGGHFERSTMYHALTLEDMLDLINLQAAWEMPMPAEWRDVAARMLGWLDVMCHPDGEIALFNDAAFGIAPTPGELRRYAADLGVVTEDSPPRQRRLLADSGYARAESPDAVLIMDVAPIGPDYLPGHAHADTLSFELSLFGRRVFVNGGTSRYGLGLEREAERGTAAHSTVTVDEQDSSEVWSGFRVARRARPFGLQLTEDGDKIRISCAHDGYRRLPGRPMHRREWQLEPGRLCVVDSVAGDYGVAQARYHLHPAVRCDADPGGRSGTLNVADARAVRWEVSGGKAGLESSVYCPEFGRREPTTCLTIDFCGADQARMSLIW
jgi:uncharacterized heparinase superfamily protein